MTWLQRFLALLISVSCRTALFTFAIIVRAHLPSTPAPLLPSRAGSAAFFAFVQFFGHGVFGNGGFVAKQLCCALPAVLPEVSSRRQRGVVGDGGSVRDSSFAVVVNLRCCASLPMLAAVACSSFLASGVASNACHRILFLQSSLDSRPTFAQSVPGQSSLFGQLSCWS